MRFKVYDRFKVYEKFALRQITDFLTENAILQSNISSYRKCHSTTTTRLAIRDDILKAMKRDEITLAVMADFSKAFDTIAFEKVLSKLHLMTICEHEIACNHP